MKKISSAFLFLLITIVLFNSCAESVDYNNIFSGTDFTDFSCAYAVEEATIDKAEKLVTVFVDGNADLDLEDFLVIFILSDGATTTVNGVPQVSGVTRNDFRDTVKYLITSGNKQYQEEWRVVIFLSEGKKENIRQIGGTISENKVLNATTYLVSEDIIIDKNIELQIRPGSILKFKEGTKLVLKAGATIKAIANSNKKILFTSVDTNSYWDGIILNNSEAEFDFCRFEKCGRTSEILTLTNNSVASITKTSFVNSQKGAIKIDSTSYLRIFEDNLIEDCGTVEKKYALIIDNPTAITAIGSTNTIKTQTGILISNSNIKNNIKFQRQTCPFVFPNDIIFDNKNLSVVIDAGVVFNIFDNKSIRIAEKNNIKFIANGNSTQPVVFTCNNKEVGAWKGIFIGKNILAGSVLKNCKIEYAGGSLNNIISSAGAINCVGTTKETFSIKNCSISNTNSHGIYFNKGADAELENNIFYNIPVGLENIHYSEQ